MGNLNSVLVKWIYLYNPRIKDYPKFLVDARKMKKLDIKESYKRKLRKLNLIFDNLIYRLGRISKDIVNINGYQAFQEALLKSTLLPERD